jgi:hypothetical protein
MSTSDWPLAHTLMGPEKEASGTFTAKQPDPPDTKPIPVQVRHLTAKGLARPAVQWWYKHPIPNLGVLILSSEHGKMHWEEQAHTAQAQHELPAPKLPSKTVNRVPGAQTFPGS